MPSAAIDIGSNSVLLLILNDDGTLLHDEARVVGLGTGLGDRGLFHTDRMAAAEQALTDYVRIANEAGIPAWSIRAVATSAARRALNAETFFAKIKRRLELSVQIITGEEEARLTWLGARRDLPDEPGISLVIDLGGGSTELAMGPGETLASRTSLPVGSVRLTEQFLSGDRVARANVARCRSWVDVALSGFMIDTEPQRVIGVAGTVTTLATMVLGLSEYDPNAVHGTLLTRAQLGRCVDRLLTGDAAERRAMVPASPDRADFLVAGATILDRVLNAAGHDALTVSDRGLRYGLISA